MDTGIYNGESISSIGDREQKRFDGELGYKMKTKIIPMKKSDVAKRDDNIKECHEVCT